MAHHGIRATRGRLAVAAMVAMSVLLAACGGGAGDVTSSEEGGSAATDATATGAAATEEAPTAEAPTEASATATAPTEAAPTADAATEAAGDVELLEVDDALIAAAQEEGELFIRYSAQQEPMELMAGDFQEQFGITVTTDRKVRAEGTELFAAEERAGRHITDIHIQTDLEGQLALDEEGLYLHYTLPTVDRMPEGTFIDGAAYPAYWTDTLLSYNPDLLSTEDAVALFEGTWDGLLDPRFAGQQIGIINPENASQAAYWFWALDQSPDYGLGFLEQVAAQAPVIAESSAEGRELLAAGEIALFIGDVEASQVLASAEGSQIRWVYPDILPAYTVVLDWVSANAPHPNAARLWAAWWHGEEGAQSMLDAGLVPVLDGIEGERPQTAPLADTDWWEPYPDDSRFTPTFEEQDEFYLDYVQQMKELFDIR